LFILAQGWAKNTHNNQNTTKSLHTALIISLCE
jgi:hypothetical protein